MEGEFLNGLTGPLSSGTNMKWRSHDDFMQGILNDGQDVDGETMFSDLIFDLSWWS